VTDNIVVQVESFLRAFKTPQGAVSALSAIVAVLGTVGILSTDLSGALQSLLAAVLTVIVAAGHQTATVALVRRAARKTAA
jgi:hypothetical protein